jgi:transposase
VNELKLDFQQAIIRLREKGWSRRAIARELGIHRETVGRYLRLDSKPASEVPAGSPPSVPQAGLRRTGEAKEDSPDAAAVTDSSASLDSKPAKVPTGSPGSRSQSARWEEKISAKLEAGLSAQRIYQDLVAEDQFAASYDSVKRFIRALEGNQPLPFRRMECAPGAEVQVDFGQGAWVLADGKRKRPHLFRMILSHSRKGYSEVVWQQTSENFIRSLENAFRSFGGVTHTTVIDNLRAAVTRADWFDPELNPKVRSFAEHYGTVILPTKPYTPRHKGKIEAGIKYAQNNALKGRTFESLTEQNQFLSEWESSVADTRIHGTTRQQVAHIFATIEQGALAPLPASVFPVFSEAPRQVHLDGHVEVAKTYYSVPPEYVRRQVWVRWDLRIVRIFNSRMEQIALHARQQPGRFSTDPMHIHSRKRAAIENGLDWLLDRARVLGKHSGSWAEAMLKNRGPQGIRVLQGFLQLAAKHTPVNVEAAAELALAHGAWQLRDLKDLLKNPTAQDRFEFARQHPLIRDLSHYEALIPDCFDAPTETNQTAKTNHESSEP